MEYNEMDPNIHAPSTSGTSTFRSSDCESDSLLASIFEKEFDRDIAERIAEISEIGDRITECRQYLNRLRKEATIKYYSTLPQDLEPDEQPSIHPAVMNIIGKRPRSTIETEQFLASNYAEQKRDTRTTRTQLCKKRKSGHLPNVRAKKSAKNDSTVQPQYIPPKIPGNPQENSSVRGNTKMHMRVLIGNVAKQIEQDGNFNPATHKWMVYVRSAPGSLAVDEQVSKVHFFLHPSYKPNDVITIYKPPFTLNRRGWGEFPMRVQLHFKNSSNKPADIIHHLKLNGARSGHHTRSAETYADLWLYPNRRAQGSKLDNSDYILSLASDMLKEEVPDFTSEVICGKCHTTSEGTDSHNCTCSIKDNTFDEGSTAMIADDSSASSSEESDFSEESHSPEETDTADSEDFHAPSTSKAAPKPLPCHTTCNINDPDALQAFLQEEIKRELFDDNIITDSAENCCILCGNIKEENEEITECNCENEHSDANTQEVNKAGTSAINIGSTSEVGMNQLKKMESDILNIEPLDFMDALGIKTEIKEESDVSSLAGSDSKISLFPFELDCSPTSILESEEVKKELQEFLENFTLETNYSEADELRPTNSITHSWPLETYCVSSEKPNVGITMNELDGKTTFVNNNTNHFTNEMSTENKQTKIENVLSTFPNCYTEATVDSNIKMEEVPIDEFINNIVDEEIILDSSNIPVEDVSLGESLQTTNEIPKPQPTLKNMGQSPAALHSQTQAVSQNKQINLNAYKQINSFQPQMKAQDNQIILNGNKPTNSFQPQMEAQDKQMNVNANKPTNSFQLQVEAQNKQINVNANKPTNSFQSQMKAQDNQIILNANKPTNSFQPQMEAQDKQINVNVNKPTNSFQPQMKAQDKQINVNANKPTNSFQPQAKAQDKQIILNANKPTNSFQPQAKAQDKQIILNANKPTNSFQPQAKAQDNQIILNANKPTNLSQPHMKASTPLKNVLVVPKNVAKKYGLLNSDESLKTVPSDLPLPLKPLVTSLEKLLSNRQKPLNVPSNLKVHSATEDIPVRSHLNGMTTSILPNKQDTTNNSQVKSTSQIVKKQKVDGTNKVYTSTGKTNLVRQGSRVSFTSNSLQNKQNPILIRPSQSFSLLRPEVRNNNSLLRLNARSPNSLLRPSISNVSQLNVVNTPRKSNVYQLNDVNMPGKSSVSQLNIVKVSQKPIVSPSNAVNGPQTPNFLKYKILKPGNAKVVKIVNATSSSQSFCENNAVSKHNLIQEHAVSSNSMLKSGSLSVPMKNITPNLPNNVQKQTVTSLELIPSKCSTPNSFIRPNLSSGPKVLCPKKEEINKTSELQITSNISEDQTDLNDLIATKNIVTLNELTEAICFPKTSIPSRPILSNTCKSEKKDINASYLDCGSSCSSPHYDSERLYLGRVQVERKHLLGGSDLLSSTVNDQILYYIQQLRCLVNTCTFLETESAVRWLVRGLPLVHSDAQMVAYKTVHPYCAYSRQVYCSWSPTRQAAAEWLRAKTVVRLLTLLQTKQVLTEPVWSTKTVYWWCRTHGYSPSFCLIGPENTSDKNRRHIEILKEKTPPTKVLEWLASVRHKVRTEAEEDVDILGEYPTARVCSDPSKRNTTDDTGGGDGKLLCGHSWVQDMHSYIATQALKLGSEPLLAGGPPQSVSATLLTHATVSLAEDLLRRGLEVAAHRGGGRIEPQDICKALFRRPEFDVLTGEGLDFDVKFSDYLQNGLSSKPSYSDK